MVQKIFSNTAKAQDSEADHFSTIDFRSAEVYDVPGIINHILNHGPNEWNYLPPDGIKAHVSGIETGESFARIAECEGSLVGVATYQLGNLYPAYEKSEASFANRTRVAEICEVVVHSDFAGRGIGSQLLEEIKHEVRRRGIKSIYIKRHEENRASAGMMRNAGFSPVDTFRDPIRTSGSCRTTVERFRFRF
jgi:GNAT superfamily N-acetyltransferase